MIIDRTHRAWIAVCVVLLVLSSVGYGFYVAHWPGGSDAGSWPGIAFGVAGTGLMIYAGLISVRKRLPRWRLGKAKTWLKGHIWLGLLSGPLILFHSGFRTGGLLTVIMLVLMALIFISGVFGLVMQRFVPGVMKSATPAETIYEQVPHVCAVLCATGDREIGAACGNLMEEAGKDASFDEKQVLADFYRRSVRPYLAPGDIRRNPLHDPDRAELLFSQVRRALSKQLQSTLDSLLKMCDERRQLDVQLRLHGWLHGWLLLHVPLAIALYVLTAAHIVATLVLY